MQYTNNPLDNHSPFPWKTERRHDGGGVPIMISTEEEWVGEVYNGPRAEADARIIAAAGDLVELARAVNAYFMGMIDAQQLAERADAAFEKAMGRKFNVPCTSHVPR